MSEGLFLHWFSVADDAALLEVSNNESGALISDGPVVVDTSIQKNGYRLHTLPFELLSLWAFHLGREADGFFSGKLVCGLGDAEFPAFERRPKAEYHYATIVDGPELRNVYPVTLLDMRLACRLDTGVYKIEAGDVRFESTLEINDWTLRGNLQRALEPLPSILSRLSVELIKPSEYLRRFVEDYGVDAFGC